MAGMSAAREDIIPFGMALGQTAVLTGLNVVGLRRRQVAKAQLHNLRRAYRALFFGEGLFAARLNAVAEQYADDPMVMKIVAFIRSRRNRPLMQPQQRLAPDEQSGDAD